MNFTTGIAAPNSTALPHPSSNLTGTSDTSLSGLNVFSALGSLALNAILQRSGADELPCPITLSLARVSPLICAADVLVALVTLLYGFCNGMGFRKSCTLYVRNTRRHLTTPFPLLGGCRLLVDVVMPIPAMVGAVTIFTANGIDARIVVWTSLFVAAPVISAIMRMAAENALAQGDINDFVQAGYGKSLLQLSDLIWCAAYACQFTLWIQVFEAFSVLPLFPDSNIKWMDVVIWISIIIATLISATCPLRLYKYWSLQNWEQKQLFVALNVGFVLVLLVGMPTDGESLAKWRHAVFVPLGAFSVVVNMLWLVTLLEDILDYSPEALRQGSWASVPAKERKGPIPDELKTRINPLLSTAPEYWRRTLMITFACCQIFYAALNFLLIENSSVGTDT